MLIIKTKHRTCAVNVYAIHTIPYIGITRIRFGGYHLSLDHHGRNTPKCCYYDGKVMYIFLLSKQIV
jgi:hypothetical protein